MTNVILVNFTNESMPHKPGETWHKDVLLRELEELAGCPEIGGRLIDLWWTFGPYDAIVVVDVPVPEKAAAFSITLSKKFNARTTTLTALTTAEMGSVMDVVAIKDGVPPRP